MRFPELVRLCQCVGGRPSSRLTNKSCTGPNAGRLLQGAFRLEDQRAAIGRPPRPFLPALPGHDWCRSPWCPATRHRYPCCSRPPGGSMPDTVPPAGFRRVTTPSPRWRPARSIRCRIRPSLGATERFAPADAGFPCRFAGLPRSGWSHRRSRRWPSLARRTIRCVLHQECERIAPRRPFECEDRKLFRQQRPRAPEAGVQTKQSAAPVGGSDECERGTIWRPPQILDARGRPHVACPSAGVDRDEHEPGLVVVGREPGAPDRECHGSAVG